MNHDPASLKLHLAELEESEIEWRPWTLVFLSGFITGATLDLFALWLYAQWLYFHL